MNESSITQKFINELRLIRDSFWWKNHATEYSERGLPDVMGVVRGTMFAFEVKVGANWLTEQQKQKILKLHHAGAVAGAVLIEGGKFYFVRAVEAANNTRSKCSKHEFTTTHDGVMYLGVIDANDA